MPAGVGGSYRSLADDVYKSTTVAENKFSVLESVKKAFSFAGGPSPPARSEPLLASSEAGEPRPQVYTVQSRTPNFETPQLRKAKEFYSKAKHLARQGLSGE
uniref:Uncharacterized protein n=1 Tax=Timema douglasi TaxID=61478 RepID=A0A7R8VHD6_TIMDO|nr:unnamed protein product [Timema douglasi]